MKKTTLIVAIALFGAAQPAGAQAPLLSRPHAEQPLCGDC
jgi:hypothetical protein